MALARIMVVEDEMPVALSLEMGLEHMGYAVSALVSSGEAAVARAAELLPDLILMDIHLEGEMDGVQAAGEITSRLNIPVVYLTAYSDSQSLDRAKASQPYGYLVKPCRWEDVRTAIEMAMHMHQVQQRLRDSEAWYRHQAQELQARNQELDAFARTVAHELQNSVSLSIGYADLLAESHTTMPPNELEEHLRTMVRQGQKMNSIIRELLLLSGLRSAAVELLPLDMGRIVSEAQGRLVSVIQYLQADFRLPCSWPTCLGHGPWVEEVWYNYISNALKYGGRPPRVELGADEPVDGSARFWVRDNGPGLSSQDIDRLFVPFARLDANNREGHGLGLSIVQKIMARLGGQAGVEGGGGHDGGCLFYFTLPCPAST